MSWQEIKVKGFDEIVEEEDLYALCVYIGNAIFAKIPLIVALKGLQYFSSYKICSLIVQLAEKNFIHNSQIRKLFKMEELLQTESSIFYFQDESCVPSGILHDKSWTNVTFICKGGNDLPNVRIVHLNDTVGLQDANIELLETKCLLALQQEFSRSTNLLTPLKYKPPSWNDILVESFNNMFSHGSVYNVCVLIGNAIFGHFPSVVGLRGHIKQVRNFTILIRNLATKNNVTNASIYLHMSFSEMFRAVCQDPSISYFIDSFIPHEILSNSMIHYEKTHILTQVPVKSYWKTPTFFHFTTNLQLPKNLHIIELNEFEHTFSELEEDLIFQKCRMAYEHERSNPSGILRIH